MVALGSDGSLKWHYKTESDAQTVPLIDNRGYIHFITADATYYIEAGRQIILFSENREIALLLLR